MTDIVRLPIVLRELAVLSVADPAPRLRRISLGGPQLDAFTGETGEQPAFRSLGPDDHIKIFFPDPRTGVLSLPQQQAGRLKWPTWPPAVSREYTPRAFDPASGRLDLEFILHGHGVAGTWAETARPGDRIHIAGPRASMPFPKVAHAVLFGDETALPALANWLERRPAAMRVSAFVFTDDPAMRSLLPEGPGAAVTFLTEPPATAEDVLALLAPLALTGAEFLWGGCERGAANALRAAARLLGVPARRCDICSYWTHGEAAMA